TVIEQCAVVAIQNLLDGQVPLTIQCRKKEDKQPQQSPAKPHLAVWIGYATKPAIHRCIELGKVNGEKPNENGQQNIKKQGGEIPEAVAADTRAGMTAGSENAARRISSAKAMPATALLNAPAIPAAAPHASSRVTSR